MAEWGTDDYGRGREYFINVVGGRSLYIWKDGRKWVVYEDENYEYMSNRPQEKHILGRFPTLRAAKVMVLLAS